MAKLMFVDDDELTLMLMEKTADILGHESIICTNATHVMELVNKNRPDLIFVDLGLQEIDGLTLTGMLKSNPETKQIPVVIVTAGRSEEDEEISLAAGASGFLNKPLRFDDLTNAIEKFMPK